MRTEIYFSPTLQAPYVTSVGGVQIVSDSISSGGFSNYYARPDFQTSAVQQYLSRADLPPSSFYNSSGRAIPDVSSFSEDVVIMIGGGQSWVGGTSCAAPVFSAIVSKLLNLGTLQIQIPAFRFPL